LRVPCVARKQGSGLLLCVAPNLSLQFNFQDQAELKSLVTLWQARSRGGAWKNPRSRGPTLQVDLDEAGKVQVKEISEIS